jgi:hypothetical protein
VSGCEARRSIGGFVMKRMIFGMVVLLSCAFEASAQDLDLDGVADIADNCSESHNSRQLDPDLDGYGNSCDADFDQDGDIDQDDLDFLVGCSDPVCDLNEDGIFGSVADFEILRSSLGGSPGPSGLACAGTVPCLPPAAVPALGGAAMGGLLLTLIASAIALRRRWMIADTHSVSNR